MSKLRPECVNAAPGAYCPRGVTAYLSIYNSVRGEHGLIHGRLHDGKGFHCAIGSFFESVDKGTALPSELIDEVAVVNDSCRKVTPKQRRTAVLRWLRWKLDQLGYRTPGRRASMVALAALCLALFACNQAPQPAVKIEPLKLDPDVAEFIKRGNPFVRSTDPGPWLVARSTDPAIQPGAAPDTTFILSLVEPAVTKEGYSWKITFKTPRND